MKVYRIRPTTGHRYGDFGSIREGLYSWCLEELRRVRWCSWFFTYYYWVPIDYEEEREVCKMWLERHEREEAERQQHRATAPEVFTK